MYLLPPLPLRLLWSGCGTMTANGWYTTRTDYYLTGPAGFRSSLCVRIWTRKAKHHV